MKPDSSLNLITLTMKQNDVDSVDGRFCKSAQNIKTSVDVDDCCVEPMARHRSPKNQREAFTKAFLMNIKSVQYKLAGLSKPAIQNVPGLRLYSTHPDALSLLSAKVFAEKMFTFP